MATDENNQRNSSLSQLNFSRAWFKYKAAQACVEIKFRAPHAIDAMLSLQLCLLDGVEFPGHRREPHSLVDFHTGKGLGLEDGVVLFGILVHEESVSQNTGRVHKSN